MKRLLFASVALAKMAGGSQAFAAFAALVVGVGLAVSVPSGARAATYDLTIDHCTGGWYVTIWHRDGDAGWYRC